MNKYDLASALKLFIQTYRNEKVIIVYDHYGDKFIGRWDNGENFDLNYTLLNSMQYYFSSNDSQLQFILSIDYLKNLLEDLK